MSTCAYDFLKTHGQDKTRKFDTEGFVPVSSLCGVFTSSYWFTKCLIDRIGDILSVVCINEKCIYSPETRAWIIIECGTTICPCIYWWSGAANESCTPQILE